LLACREKIEAAGITVKYQIRHEVIESIYFDDPNGYSLEVTWQVRPFEQVDIDDAARTLAIAVALEGRQAQTPFTTIDQVWTGKGQALGFEFDRALKQTEEVA
jgi:catechol-2,3-dioxygenase